MSLLLPSLLPCWLVRVDRETGVPDRDERGRCVKCQPGEVGELV